MSNTMIMFKEDWGKFPAAIADLKTKNTTFIRYSALLKSMNVENHLFPLQLLDPRIQGLDPFSPDLTLAQMMMILVEARNNIFYFLRECVRVPGSKDDDPLVFRANRANMALVWTFLNNIDPILIQPRQTGKSFSTDTLMIWLLNLRCYHTEINLLTKDDTLRAANLERLKEIELGLPTFLRMRKSGDIANSEELKISRRHNRYRGHLPNKSPKLALNVGRGLTSPIFHIDEAAFFYNVGISVPAALAAGTAARDRARARNDPFGTIFTTTAGKIDDRDGAWMYQILIESALWTEKFMDARNKADLHEKVLANAPGKKLTMDLSFNHRQLGYDDNWLRQAIADSRATGEDARRDFLNAWTRGNQSSPLSVEELKIIADSERKDFFSEFTEPHAYVIRWFIPEERISHVMNNGHFIIGLDTSDAVGRDDIGLVIRDISTGAVVGAGNYNELNLITFAEWLAKLMIRFKRTTLVPERRSSAVTIIDYLLLMLPAMGEDPFARIYNTVVQTIDENKELAREISRAGRTREIYVKYKSAFGFATSGSGITSRTDLYSNTLRNASRYTGSMVHDVQLIRQIMGLVIRNGRVDHEEGKHDDLCMAWLLSFWLITKGRNLHYYGIQTRSIMALNGLVRSENDPAKVAKQNQERLLKEEIDKLAERLKKEPDNFIAYRLEGQLKILLAKLPDTPERIASVQELMETIKTARKKSRY